MTLGAVGFYINLTLGSICDVMIIFVDVNVAALTREWMHFAFLEYINEVLEHCSYQLFTLNSECRKQNIACLMELESCLWHLVFQTADK
jgi:hypothetical protein